MAISLTAQRFLEAFGKHELERIVLKETAPAVHVDTGNQVLDECLNTVMAVNYRVEFAPRDRDKMLVEAATGRIDFAIIPEYSRQTYALGRECEQLLNAYLKEYGLLQNKIRGLAGKKQDAQAALERQAGAEKKNGNGGNADKARIEKEAEGRARHIHAIEDQIRGYNRESADAETKLQQLALSDTMKRIQVLTGVLKTRAQSAPWQELVRYGITPADSAQPVLCSIPDNLAFPERAYDHLAIEGVIPVKRAPVISRRAAVAAGIAGLLGGAVALRGIELFTNNKSGVAAQPVEKGPQPLQEGRDYLIEARQAGYSNNLHFQHGETFAGHKVSISPEVLPERGQWGKHFSLTLSRGDGGKRYELPFGIMSRVILDGKEHIISMSSIQAEDPQRHNALLVSYGKPTVELYLKLLSHAQERFVPPLRIESLTGLPDQPPALHRETTTHAADNIRVYTGDAEKLPAHVKYTIFHVRENPSQEKGQPPKLPPALELILKGEYRITPTNIIADKLPLLQPK